MNIGDEILIRVKIVDLDSNPHGSAIKVEVRGFIGREDGTQPLELPIRFWIFRLDQPYVIARE